MGLNKNTHGWNSEYNYWEKCWRKIFQFGRVILISSICDVDIVRLLYYEANAIYGSLLRRFVTFFIFIHNNYIPNNTFRKTFRSKYC